MKPVETTHFGIQRKIVANMTSESWERIPHVTYLYEPDVTDLMREYKQLNFDRPGQEKISVNTLVLKLICEGLKAAPAMNAHIRFDRRLVRGEVTTYQNIDISMPMVLPNGEMMTVNLHDFENKNLDEMTAYIADVSRRAANTDLNEAMFEVSLDNTLAALRRGKLGQAVCRLIGSKTGKHKVRTLHGEEKRAYEAVPKTDRLTKTDLTQGTVTVSNLGSLYRGQRGECALLEIIPPQVAAFGVGAVQDKPVVVRDAAGKKQVEARQVLPICIAFDHRALDFGDIVPFLKKFDSLLEHPQVIHTWKTRDAHAQNAKEA